MNIETWLRANIDFNNYLNVARITLKISTIPLADHKLQLQETSQYSDSSWKNPPQSPPSSSRENHHGGFWHCHQQKALSTTAPKTLDNIKQEGGVLSPLLCNIYIWNLPITPPEIELITYATLYNPKDSILKFRRWFRLGVIFDPIIKEQSSA